ncbi:RNase P/MRP, p29 subunit [Ophiobolus disseminans]|uniref:Ribonuclease P protein subunit n=1 Tax=Ophiobolus disseminans TaxID=1469910 RepID=A0A6A7A7N9_9PLEO|nr:RNase P/MRP, p29 subunit [Ophiobolus disseminans]
MTESNGPPFGQVLLGRAFSPDTAKAHYTERIVKRALPIRATSPTPSARAVRRRALDERKAKTRRRSKQKPRPLSAAEKRKLCMNEMPKEQQKYALYEPLHKLWLGYMRDMLGLDDTQRAVYLTPASSGQILASADVHGALLSIVRSRCVSRVGLQGIVVRDTQFTFEIITKKNVLKAIPKEHTVFRFEIPQLAREGEAAPQPLVFDVFGEQFQTRAADRANKKFRMHYSIDI